MVSACLPQYRGGKTLIRDGEATARKSLLVLLDGDAIQLDRAHQRVRCHRHQALLPRGTEHDHVGKHGIAEQRVR